MSELKFRTSDLEASVTHVSVSPRKFGGNGSLLDYMPQLVVVFFAANVSILSPNPQEPTSTAQITGSPPELHLGGGLC